mmetsp:Transcript_13699/g.9868  ORF Transcript_13699/g.9868 Transcript_13699/m.9868 type:complete len:201 (-) Transcript_13699:612-1214(-)|eukprot:CAMPEP_0202963300 /NCGR_PEP_ID=MMETSP1396-20130829/7284_1 /ASSEMBLY_ACC=CAM_ASM_000872 /TAXON_ID= /ORGANISM="Pseudokeronopsis sp., Strain Brazil" /LENGTH=200 /DNA_ID=CAMNT_0049684387 /DNA_START=208 /DNA_END=810 /DNA_ORIENTATION=-
MQETFHIFLKLLSDSVSHSRYVEVDDELDFRYIKSSCQHVGCDDNLHFPVSELLDVLVSLFVGHVSEDDVHLVVVLPQQVVQNFSVLLVVHEYQCLRKLNLVQHPHQELWLLPRITSAVELLYVVQMLVLLRLYVYLPSLLYYLANLFLYVFSVGGREEDVLNVFESGKVFVMKVFQVGKVFGVFEEEVGFVNDDHFECG